jgi:hypothetical protein
LAQRAAYHPTKETFSSTVEMLKSCHFLRRVQRRQQFFLHLLISVQNRHEAA